MAWHILLVVALVAARLTVATTDPSSPATSSANADTSDQPQIVRTEVSDESSLIVPRALTDIPSLIDPQTMAPDLHASHSIVTAIHGQTFAPAMPLIATKLSRHITEAPIISASPAGTMSFPRSARETTSSACSDNGSAVTTARISDDSSAFTVSSTRIANTKGNASSSSDGAMALPVG